jgi:hypothetical protein
MSDYYLLRDNQTLGPYTAADIRAWALAGQLPATDIFCPVGGQQWGPLSQWPELASPAPYAPTPTAISGLSAWITRGWETVSTDAGAFILAALIVMGLSILTVGICGPPLSAGLYIMALRKHDGHAVSAGDVMEGFKFFGATWGLALIILIPVMLVMGLVFGIAFAASGKDMEQVLPFLQMGLQLPASAVGYFIGTALLFAIPMIVDLGYGPVQAIEESWAAVKPQFWSYLGAYIILALISSAGMMACGVGMLFTYPLSVACIIAVYRSRFPAKGGRASL